MLEVSVDEALLHGGTVSDTREARDLGTLIRVATALTSVQDLAMLDAALAGLMLDLVPVTRVVFIRRGPGTRRRSAPRGPPARSTTRSALTVTCWTVCPGIGSPR